MIRQPLCLLVLSTSVFYDTVPPEAATLRAKRDAKISEINRVYIDALSKLMDRYAAAGDSENAAKVKKMLDEPNREAGSSGDEAKLKPLIGVWKRDTDNGVWNIPDTKGGVFNGNLAFTMSFDAENNRIAVVGSHWADYLSFTPNPDVVNGSTKINGKTARYRLKRIK